MTWRYSPKNMINDSHLRRGPSYGHDHMQPTSIQDGHCNQEL
jgi:hypothetical protein